MTTTATTDAPHLFLACGGFHYNPFLRYLNAIHSRIAHLERKTIALHFALHNASPSEHFPQATEKAITLQEN